MIYPSEETVNRVLIGEAYSQETRGGGADEYSVWTHTSGWRVRVALERGQMGSYAAAVALHPGHRPHVAVFEPYEGLTEEGWLSMLARGIRVRDLPELLPE